MNMIKNVAKNPNLVTLKEKSHRNKADQRLKKELKIIVKNKKRVSKNKKFFEEIITPTAKKYKLKSIELDKDRDIWEIVSTRYSKSIKYLNIDQRIVFEDRYNQGEFFRESNHPLSLVTAYSYKDNKYRYLPKDSNWVRVKQVYPEDNKVYDAYIELTTGIRTWIRPNKFSDWMKVKKDGKFYYYNGINNKWISVKD